MELDVANERAFVLTEQLTMDLAEGRAWEEKMGAFGALARVSRLLQRPRDDEFEVTHREVRYEPFWHVVVSSRATYRRQREYRVPVAGAEVRAVTVEGRELPVADGAIYLLGDEYCTEESRQDVYMDGISGQPNPALSGYLRHDPREVPPHGLNSFGPAGAVILPPTTSASALVRQLMAPLCRAVEADEILQESVHVEAVDLYFRPIYAFRFHWLLRNRDGVVECNALTGEFSAGGRMYDEGRPERVDADALFDLDPNQIESWIPGGHIVVSSRLAFEKAEPPQPMPEDVSYGVSAEGGAPESVSWGAADQGAETLYEEAPEEPSEGNGDTADDEAVSGPL